MRPRQAVSGARTGGAQDTTGASSMSENLVMAALDTADLMAIEGGRGRCHGHGGHEGQGGRQGGSFNNQLYAFTLPDS